uniref:MN1 proto-onco, transcriptional regulator n=1 Tax=Paramormyrops kingsleyae TaxID=1676925 RepID=A0A3B3QQ74_9TELE|nr:transcriptional activator MN1-like isoform X2 [Paramormyrops kingsleyae]
MFGLEQFGSQIHSRKSGQREGDSIQQSPNMNPHYKNPAFHSGGAPVASAQGMAPLSESGAPFGFPPQGHPDLHPLGLQHHQQMPQMHTYFSEPVSQGPHHPHFGARLGAPGATASCIHGGRLPAFHQGFSDICEPLPLGPVGEGFSQPPQRSGALPDFQSQAPPDRSHVVPAPCLPLDQSPNRAASFHGLPTSTSSSSSSEPPCQDARRLPPSGRLPREYGYPGDAPSGPFGVPVFSPPASDAHIPPYSMGGPVIGDGSSHCNPGIPRAGIPKTQHPPPAGFYDRFGMGRKVHPGVGPGGRHPSMQHPQAGAVGRQGPCSSGLLQSPSSSHPGMQDGGLMLSDQQGQFEYPTGRLDGNGVHPYGDPMFNMQPLPPPSQRLQHFDSSYEHAAKRLRFDIPSRDGCGNWGSSLHSPQGGNSHISPSAYPGLPGDFPHPSTDGFPLAPPIQHGSPQQQRQNAAMMIKQMASRTQHHRNRPAGPQHLDRHGNLPPSNIALGSQVGDYEGPNFERANVDGQATLPPQENPWYPSVHPRGDIPPCRLGGTPRLPMPMGLQHSSGDALYRPGPSRMSMQDQMRLPHNSHSHCQSLMSPGIQSQFGNSIGGHQQMRSPGSAPSLPNRPADFTGAPAGPQLGFPFGGVQRQAGTPQNNALSGSFRGQPEFPNGQRLSSGNLGTLSLDILGKSSGKEGSFGQSCLAALSTACQNMIASLGAPNLNVTFNKKGPSEPRHKPSLTDQDPGGGVGGVVSDRFQGDTSQGSRSPGSSQLLSQGEAIQIGPGEVNAPSPNFNVDAPPGGEGRGHPGCGRGRWSRKEEGGCMSPGDFFSSEGGTPTVTPSASGGERGSDKLQEEPLTSWGKGDNLLLGDQPDLMSSLDSGIQSVPRSDGSSPQGEYPDDTSGGFVATSYGNEDEVSSSSDTCKPACSPLVSGSPRPLRMMGGQHPPSMAPAGYTLGTPGTTHDELHPLEILQAQIQLQRQQFNISDDRTTGAKGGGRIDGDAEPPRHRGPGGGKATADAIDLDSLMAEQHAAWFVPGDKATGGSVEDDNSTTASWEKAGSHGNHREGTDPSAGGGGACLAVHCTDELAEGARGGAWHSLHSDISGRFGTYVAALT